MVSQLTLADFPQGLNPRAAKVTLEPNLNELF